MYRYALLYGRFIVGTLSQIAASLHCSKYLPYTIVTMPLRSLKICFQKEKYTWKPRCQEEEGKGGKGELKQQFVQTSHFSLGPAANRSPLDGQRICQRVCLHLPQPTTHPHSPFHFSIIVCGKKRPLPPQQLGHNHQQHSFNNSPCCCPPLPPSARSLLDLARLDLVFTTSDLCVNIAFVSASNLAIRSAFARSRPAYLQKGIFNYVDNCRCDVLYVECGKANLYRSKQLFSIKLHLDIILF